MAKRILEVHMAAGTTGSHHTHIESVKWADEIVPSAVSNEKLDRVAQRVRAGTYFYSSGKDNLRARVEAYQLNGAWYIRTVGDETKPDNLLSLPRY